MKNLENNYGSLSCVLVVKMLLDVFTCDSILKSCGRVLCLTDKRPSKSPGKEDKSPIDFVVRDLNDLTGEGNTKTMLSVKWVWEN